MMLWLCVKLPCKLAVVNAPWVVKVVLVKLAVPFVFFGVGLSKTIASIFLPAWIVVLFVPSSCLACNVMLLALFKEAWLAMMVGALMAMSLLAQMVVLLLVEPFNPTAVLLFRLTTPCCTLDWPEWVILPSAVMVMACLAFRLPAWFTPKPLSVPTKLMLPAVIPPRDLMSMAVVGFVVLVVVWLLVMGVTCPTSLIWLVPVTVVMAYSACTWALMLAVLLYRFTKSAFLFGPPRPILLVVVWVATFALFGVWMTMAPLLTVWWICPCLLIAWPVDKVASCTLIKPAPVTVMPDGLAITKLAFCPATSMEPANWLALLLRTSLTMVCASPCFKKGLAATAPTNWVLAPVRALFRTIPWLGTSNCVYLLWDIPWTGVWIWTRATVCWRSFLAAAMMGLWKTGAWLSEITLANAEPLQPSQQAMVNGASFVIKEMESQVGFLPRPPPKLPDFPCAFVISETTTNLPRFLLKITR